MIHPHAWYICLTVWFSSQWRTVSTAKILIPALTIKAFRAAIVDLYWQPKKSTLVKPFVKTFTNFSWHKLSKFNALSYMFCFISLYFNQFYLYTQMFWFQIMFWSTLILLFEYLKLNTYSYDIQKVFKSIYCLMEKQNYFFFFLYNINW